jgi:hypothetical protein
MNIFFREIQKSFDLLDQTKTKKTLFHESVRVYVEDS